MTEKTLAGRFLVATPSMKDPFFSKTVILLVGHNAGTGALGLVLNRESSVTMEEACRQLGFECTADPSARLGWGGPVANTRGFIVHAPAADGEPLIFTDGELALGASANLLKAIAEGKGPAKHRFGLRRLGTRAARRGDRKRRLADCARGQPDCL